MLTHKSEGIFHTAFSPDGKMVATGSDDGTIRIWSTKNGIHLHTLKMLKSISGIQFIKNNNTLVAVTSDETISIWSIDNWLSVATYESRTEKKNDVFKAIFSPDEAYIATGSRAGSINIFSLKTGKFVKKYLQNSSSIMSLAFSPDGKFIASGNRDSTIWIHDLTNDSESKVLKGHDAYVWDVKFTSDENSLISVSEDHTARVWSLEYGFVLWTHSDRNYHHYNIGITNIKEKHIVIFDGTSVWEFNQNVFGNLRWIIDQAEKNIGAEPPFSYAECRSLKIRTPKLCAPYIRYTR